MGRKTNQFRKQIKQLLQAFIIFVFFPIVLLTTGSYQVSGNKSGLSTITSLTVVDIQHSVFSSTEALYLSTIMLFIGGVLGIFSYFVVEFHHNSNMKQKLQKAPGFSAISKNKKLKND
jgi:ABC-type uncharacterized transport system permease subunit